MSSEKPAGYDFQPDEFPSGILLGKAAPASEPPIDVAATVALMEYLAGDCRQPIPQRALLNSVDRGLCRTLAARIPGWVAADGRLAEAVRVRDHETSNANHLSKCLVTADQHIAELEAENETLDALGQENTREVDRLRIEHAALVADRDRYQTALEDIAKTAREPMLSADHADAYWLALHALGRLKPARAASDAAGEPTT